MRVTIPRVIERPSRGADRFLLLGHAHRSPGAGLPELALTCYGIGVERGTVAIIDALGFRGIWKGRGGEDDKERAEKVIASLNALSARFESEKARAAFYGSAQPDADRGVRDHLLVRHHRDRGRGSPWQGRHLRGVAGSRRRLPPMTTAWSSRLGEHLDDRAPAHAAC